MSPRLLTPEQLSLIKEVEDPIARRRFALLYRMPEELQEKFFAEETTDTIWLVLKSRHQLADEDLIAVSRIVGLIFLGEIRVKDFIRQLMSDLQIDQPKAAAIAKDVNEQIFQPVRGSLLEVHGLNADSTRTVADNRPGLEEKKEKLVETGRNLEAGGNQLGAVAPRDIHRDESKPLTLEELEKREAERHAENEGSVGNVAKNQASRAREELVERLRKAREEQRQNQAPQRTVTIEPNEQDGESRDDAGSEPQAKTTAWNGRTIDLRRIPPRRKSPKENGNGAREVEIYEA